MDFTNEKSYFFICLLQLSSEVYLLTINVFREAVFLTD